MNKLLIIIILCFFPLLSFAEKRALLIGIGAYTYLSDWQQLHSENDVEILAKTLISKGFSIDNTAIILNEKADKGGIVVALKKLFQQTMAGDVVYFHFSGHGQQVKDQNQDEIDGYDEALVTFNSPKHYKSGIYEGENLLRDDELDFFFQQIRLKIGDKGQLIASFDACHSGTATRGFKIARGTDEKMADASYQQNWAGNKYSAVSNFKEYDFDKTTNIAPYVGLFSSGAQQLSYEEHLPEGDCGLFTYYLSKNLLTSSSSTSYKAVFDKIKLDFIQHNALQIPEIEGKADLAIFGESTKTFTEGILITEWFNSKNVGINMGSIMGLTEGSEIALYDKEQKVLARGTLDDISPFHAFVLLDKPLSKKQALNTYGKILKAKYEIQTIKLKTNVDWKGKLSQIADIEWVTENADFYLEPENSTNCRLFNSDSIVIKTFTSGENIPNNLAQIFAKWRKNKAIRELNVVHENLKATLFFKNENGEKIENTVKVGTKLRIVVENEGNFPFYFSIIDISSNQEMALIVPFERPASEFYLKPKQQYISDFVIQVTEPIGNELLKLIATTEPIDMSNFNTMNTKGIGLERNPIEKIFHHTFMTNTKGVSSVQLTNTDALVKTFWLTIEK